MIRFSCSVIAIVISSGAALAQDAAPAKTPAQWFEEARDLISQGSFDVAADVLGEFVKSGPTAQDYLSLEQKHGPTTFLKLQAIPRWYDDPKRNDAFRKGTLEKIVADAKKAGESLLRNEARIRKFVRNLSGLKEEYDFAVQELKRSGDAVVPILVESLRTEQLPEARNGILRAVKELGPETIPGLLAAAENFPENNSLKNDLLKSILDRSDLLMLTSSTDTNPIPYLWYLASRPATEKNALREQSAAKLRELFAAAFDRRLAEDELVRSAQSLYKHQGKFQAAQPDPKDKSTPQKTLVRLWDYDAKANKVSFSDVSVPLAEESFGLKYLRWAVERNAKYDPAQDLFLTFAVERAVERAKFASLASSNPAAFRLLAAAPVATLIRLGDQAILQNQTALLLGIVEALGDRAEVQAGNAEIKAGGAVRQPVLVKALDYADPRVQLAAALALLKIPNAKHGAHARIVDILNRSIAPDASSSTGAGKAIVADSSALRGDQVANLLRAIGYQVEVVGTGRQLAQRIDRTADFDIVLVDRHIVNPLLPDLIPQLRGDPNAANRPLFIVASPDERAQLGLETLLARLAALIAATETVPVELEPVPEVDRRRTPDETEEIRKLANDRRDKQLREIYRQRLARLERLVTAANFSQGEALKRRLDMRLPQLTMAGMVADFDLTPGSAPKFIRDLAQLTDLIRRQDDLTASTRDVDTQALLKLVRQLEAVLTPELQKKFDAIRARFDEDQLALTPDVTVDPATAVELARLARTYPGVSVIREPYSKIGFERDVEQAMPDAAARPRDPMEKAAAAKAAVDALARMATGGLPGYDIRPATDALRAALLNDELAPGAAAALARSPAAGAQTDLLKVATDSNRKLEPRTAAANAAIQNYQSFGKIASAEAISLVAKAAPAEGTLASQLAILNTLFHGTPATFPEALKDYELKLPAAAPAKAKEKAKPMDDQKPMDDAKPMEEKKPMEEPKPMEEKKGQ